MTPGDAARLLAMASTACPTVPKPDEGGTVAKGWAAVLADVELGEALEAATGLIRELGEVTPHLIFNRVQAARRAIRERENLAEALGRGERRAQIEAGTRPEGAPRPVDALAAALTVACRFCHVAPGYRCRSRDARGRDGERPLVRIPHSGRIGDARRAGARPPEQLALPAGSDTTTAGTPAPAPEETTNR